MQVRFSRLLCGLASIGISWIAHAQVSTSVSASGNVVTGTMGFSGPRMFGNSVTGAPYSAQRVSEHVQIGADGTRFTSNSQQETVYRDSQGRIRTERSVRTGPNQVAGGPVVVEIQDPVANVGYVLDSQNKVAHRMALQTAEMRRAAAGRGGGAASGGIGASIGPSPAAQQQSGAMASVAAASPAATVPAPTACTRR